ncbi:holin family protein [Maridesulfovibrio bastinii]|uniref:holin family protein n=1 Tax=Maridesulfovibrio bastinii TaxID=47157 RepID=UPI000416FB74|nr:holin family protein [Maridesulfovibrio bastinii]
MSVLGAVKIGKEVGDAAGGVIGAIGKLFDDLFTSDEEREEAKLKLFQMYQNGDLTELDARIKVMLAEMNGNWLQRSWRPILMLTIVAIVANNYLLYPYLSLFWTKAPEIVLPVELWELMKIGVGGYTVGRSAEKFADIWRSKK